jgi:hypothetical protein
LISWRAAAILRALASPGASRLAIPQTPDGGARGQYMASRKPTETDARTDRDSPRESRVRAALRDRRRRRAHEAGLQSAVRRLATEAGRDR